VVLNFE